MKLEIHHEKLTTPHPLLFNKGKFFVYVEDLWEWLDRMSTKYPDDPIHVLRELHLKLEEK